MPKSPALRLLLAIVNAGRWLAAERVSLVAAYFPARRAAVLDPTQALRSE